ncbi:MAG: hypothetical protein JXJ04_11080 [Spirochaetales bacterium]|nr:hypothetical protein [Spirochaetales bacterium]
MMDKETLLKQAKKHCFFIGLNDSGSELCKANSVYGIAAMHYIQEKLGVKANATFITTPDMTITRNVTRWRSGFGYGGKLSWGDGSSELIVLNTKPNACGMLAGGLEELPPVDRIIERIHRLASEKTLINGIEVAWDFYKSNHFIDLFLTKQIQKLDHELPPYAFIIHGSAGEFSGNNKNGFGLYYDRSEELMNMAEEIETPIGTYYVLTGKNANAYYEFYKTVEDFSKKKKEYAAKKIFGDYLTISNECHQGLLNMNQMLLGCNHMKQDNTLFPLTLRGDLPAYLVRGMPSLSPDCIDTMGFEKRARNLGVYDQLINLNIFPHGGGYNLPDVLNVNKVIEIEKTRYFDVDMLNDRGKKIISDVRELPFEYRGRTVVLRAIEAGLIEIVAKLIPQYILKI